jgi:ribonuclease HI
MEVEAALPPPKIRLNASVRQYAFRVLKLASNHPINLEAIRLTTSSNKLGRPSQLERIKDSIQGLVDTRRLEPIRHYYFAPWDRKTPYLVQISSLAKAEEAKAHNDSIRSLLGSKLVGIYTDASYTLEGSGVGVGLVAYDYSQERQGQITTQKLRNLGEEQLVYNGELEGATQGIEYASRIAKPGWIYKVYSDNQAGLYRLKTPSDNPGQACQIRAIQAAKLVYEKGANISLNWVPGHEDVQGNEKADRLAKMATNIPSTSNETSWALLGMKIKGLRLQEWTRLVYKYVQKQANPESYSRKYKTKLGSKLLVPQGTKRHLASTLYQLKFGHGYFRSYLSRLGHSTNNRCYCGAKESPEHLLLSCPELSEARIELKRDLPAQISLQLLLHTSIGIEKTLAFLARTKIATRAWNLERGRISEEDDGDDDDGDDDDDEYTSSNISRLYE